MASAVGKTPPKAHHDTKKESTPNKPDQKNVPEKKEAAQKQEDTNKSNDQRNNRRDYQNRGDRFQNRRGGGNRHFNQRGPRGGFHGSRDRSESRESSQGNSSANASFPEFQGMAEEDTGPKEQKKFTGRCRLFVGNITPDTTEEQFKELFTPYGEVSEVFVNASRGFGFIRMDYRINAERAKLELDGQMRNNRVLRVRFATHGAALRVYNLSPFVSNELLEQAFSQFGEVERAVVIVDVRGRSCGEGIVEFARKPGANAALKRISEGIFLMSTSLRPVRVEPVDQKDEEDGLTEKLVQKNDGFRKDREKEPRFAPPGSFEFDFGMKYKRIDDREKEALDRVKQDHDNERQRLVEEMETAVFDYQAEQIRQDLMRQQEELKRLDAMKNEHMRRRQELDMRRQEQMRSQDSIMMQEEERRREDERRREMMMRASNTMNMEGGIGGISPRAGRPDDMMMRGPPPGNMRESPQRGGGLVPNQRSQGPGTPPMPPPPVPPGMNMDQPNRPENRFGPGGPGMPGNMGGASPGGPGGASPRDRPPEMPIKPEPMQRPGPPNQGGRFPGPSGPGNFPPGMGNMGPGPNMFPKMPGPGPMGNKPNMGGNDRRREGGRRDDFDNSKRMRRY